MLLVGGDVDIDDGGDLEEVAVEVGHLLVEGGIVEVLLKITLRLGAHAGAGGGVVDETVDGVGDRLLVAWGYEDAVHTVVDILGLCAVVAADVCLACHHIL